MTARIVVLIAALAMLSAACDGGDEAHEHDTSHEHLEIEEVPEGQQAFEVKDGRVGWRRVPLIDVSSVEFVDHRNGPSGESFLAVAPPEGLLLLFFGYTSCPDVCPTTLADYRAVFDEMPPELAERTAFGMISIDPERDGPDQIEQYVSLFIDDGHALLAGDDADLAQATEAFGVQYEIEAHEPGETDYLVGHTSIVFAIDQDGQIIWEFGYQTPSGEVAAALVELFDERY